MVAIREQTFFKKKNPPPLIIFKNIFCLFVSILYSSNEEYQLKHDLVELWGALWETASDKGMILVPKYFQIG